MSAMTVRRGTLVAVSMAALLAAFKAMAQIAPVGPPPSGRGTPRLEEIVVTAQRRGQKLQKVPITISVISSAQLKSAGITDTTAITAATPGLTITTNGPSGSVFVRGIGSNAGQVNQEPSVALYVDDVYIASPSQNQFSLNNVDQVSVLKGPQGTLFGRNATGGVIQITTRDPSNTPRLDASLGYGNYNTISGDLYATGPLTDQIAADLAVVGDTQQNGWGHNVFTGGKLYRFNDISARSKVRWRPDADTTVRLSLDFDQSYNGGLDYRNQPKEFAVDGQPGYVGFYNSRSNTPSSLRRLTGGVSLKIEHDFGAVRLVSITAYRQLSEEYRLDEDRSPLTVVAATLHEYAHNYSQELQLLSQAGKRFDWVIGLYAYGLSAGDNPAAIDGLAVSPLPFLDEYSLTRTHSGSLYGQATYALWPDTHLTGGYRYTIERQYDHDYGQTDFGTGPLTIIGPFRQHQGFNKSTFRVSLDHQFTPDLLGYISYNRGIKSGGFDTLSLGTPGYKPEQVDAYEAGFKDEVLDHRLRLNVSGFYYDYKNIQEQVAVTGGTVTVNAAEAHISGTDIDFRFAATSNLTLYGGGEYLNSVYASFPGAQAYSANPGPEAPDPDVVGKYTIQAPRFTGNVGADYKIPTPSGDFGIDGNYFYNNGFFWDSANRLSQPAYALLSASVSWTSPGGRYGLLLWSKNLANAHYLAAGLPINGLGDSVQPAAPRTYGFSASVHF